MRLVRGVGTTFIVLGFTLLLFVVYELVGTSMVTNRHQAALAQEFQASPVVEQSPAPAPKRPSRGDPVARIKIPKIDVNKIVVSGTTLDDLAYGPGHYRETSLPWEPGPVAVAGHRTGWGSPFIDLDRLRKGDEVVLETKHGTYRYRVTRSVIVEPEETWVLDGDPESSAENKLTLTTCTPKYTSRLRLIVWADAVEEAEA